MKAPSVLPGLLILVALVAGACGGGEEPPPAGTPAGEPPAPGTEQAAPPTQEAAPSQEAAPAEAAAPTAAAPAGGEAVAPQGPESRLMRELFVYRGAGRDPFMPLTSMDAVRPLFEDLRVTGITFDPRYPGNSVAVLRDTSEVCATSATLRCRYTVRVGDEVGQVRILEIRTYEIVVVREQFGIEQQRVLRLRGRQEGTP